MATLLAYRCPQSGLMTQTWLGAEPAVGDNNTHENDTYKNDTYEAVSCLACSKQHFICLASGHVLGEDEAHPSSRRVPGCQPKQIRRIHDRPHAPVASERMAGEAAGVARTPTHLPKAS
jgi:hypothetical protein